MTYEECKEIAIKKAHAYDITLIAAYDLNNDFVFDNPRNDAPGITPFVVKSDDGECVGLWRYLNDYDLSMDDMISRTF